MEIKYLLKGIVIGVSIAAPVGPIGLLCIKRSLTHGFRAGLVTGLIAGSSLWWTVLASASATAGKRLNREMTEKINMVAGMILIVFGFWILRGVVV